MKISLNEREQTCTIVTAIRASATTELYICRKGVCEMAVRSRRKYEFGTRNCQQVIEARTQVMVENFLRYSHFPVIEILKQKMVNHLHKVKKTVKRWTTVESIQTHLNSIITDSLITEPNVQHR